MVRVTDSSGIEGVDGNGPRKSQAHLELGYLQGDDNFTVVYIASRRVLANIYNLNEWGIERNITRSGGATALAQIKKLREEIDELEAAILAEDEIEIVDGLGDALTVLVQMHRLLLVSLEESTDRAWSQIRYRKGRMENGVFVKQADLDKRAAEAEQMDKNSGDMK